MGLVAASAEVTGTLTRVEDIRIMSREAASGKIPVRLEAVVLLVTDNGFFIHDGYSSIWVEFAAGSTKTIWREGRPAGFGPGAVVELEAFTVPGGYAPSIQATSIRFLRQSELPVPRRPSMDILVSGTEDCQWLELEGVVQGARPVPLSRSTSLTLAVGGHFCELTVSDGKRIHEEDFVDARVRVRGVFSAQPNLRGQMSGLRLFVSGPEFLEVIKPPPVDPFETLPVPLVDLLPFRIHEDPGHRKVTRGVVSFVYPGRFFFIQDEKAGIRVDSPEAEVTPGMEVDVAGFAMLKEPLAGLGGALVRPTGRWTEVEPVPVTSGEVISPPLRVPWVGIASEDLHGRFVRITGRLLKAETAPGGREFALVVESGKSIFTALIPGQADRQMPADWIPGSEISLDGTCELEFANQAQVGNPYTKISGFRLWLPSVEQVIVLQTPSWWTPQRLWSVMGGLGLILALAFTWIGLLRREVARRGIRLAGEISERREAELEFRSTLRERERLAQDLHDTLEQALSGLSLQLQAAELFQHNEPPRSARHLRLAQQFLDRSREDLHRTVWDLRNQELDLVNALRERAAMMSAEGSVEIQITDQGDGRFVPQFSAANLFLLALESITNAVRHSGASRIEVTVQFPPDGVQLRVTDNGRGFDPSSAPDHHDGHFGLQGMRERAKRIGATLSIDSRPGGGTTIEVRVPMDAMIESTA